MMYLLKLLLYCCCLTIVILSVEAAKTDGSFENAESTDEFITMSFSSSHSYDLRQTIPGEPEVDYPIYSAVPKTDFDCNGRHEGYYADIETRCQVFRICANTDLIGKGFAFLCPNGTLFSQKNFVCDWYRNVDCGDSERYYSKNDLNHIGTKTDMMRTVRQMMEHPMKTISMALNRGTPTTSKPSTYYSPSTSTSKIARSSHTTSAPITRIPTKSSVQARQSSVPVKPVDIDLRFSSPDGQSPTNGKSDLTSLPSEKGFKPSHGSALITHPSPPSPTFAPPFESPIEAPYGSPLSSEVDAFGNSPFESQPGEPPISSDNSASEKEVYISSLGELSTDPGSNFNRQTSRIISDSPSNSLDGESKLYNANKMNFAEKVNEGIKGVPVVNRNEVIAPEYVKNIMQRNVVAPSDKQTHSSTYDFASNVNSLLDEVTYETELEAQNSMQVPQRASPSTHPNAPSKKPFRFLSRGFSYDKEEGPYVYGPASAPRTSYSSGIQHSTSIQSPSNSFHQTTLATTSVPITSTQDLALKNAPEESTIEGAVPSSFNFQISPNDQISENNNTISEGDSTTTPFISEGARNDRFIDSDFIYNPDSESESDLTFKAAIKREQRELANIGQQVLRREQKKLNPKKSANSALDQKVDKIEQKQSASSEILSDLPQELHVEDKTNANKQAENLLLAGVKKSTANDKATEEEEPTAVIPIYNRATDSQISSSTTSATLTTSSTVEDIVPVENSTPSTTTTLPTSTTTSSSTSSVSTTSSSTSSTTPEPTSSTTSEPTSSTTTEPILTTPAQSFKRLTGDSANRRKTSKPLLYARRKSVVRSGARTTSTTKATPTAASPTFRGRSGNRLTSTSTSTTPATFISGTSTTSRPTASTRRRPPANRYGLRRRTTPIPSSTSTTSTTDVPSKKISARSSEESLSDLTALASTYDAAPNRAYNSIRQNSYKYSQAQRRKPNHKKNNSESTTPSSTTSSTVASTTTTQQPQISSSFPTPTLAPFSYHEALSPMPLTSTTSEPLPATFLSFNDLTKSITDDSILQNLRKNQEYNRPSKESTFFGGQQQFAPIRQQIPFSTAPRIQQEVSTQRPTLKVATSLPFIPLKDFIASKFGSQYSPEPPKLSTTRPALISPSGVVYDILSKSQKKTVYNNQQNTNQQYGSQTPLVVKPFAPVQQSVLSAGNQNFYQQQPQFNVQQQQKYQQQQYQQQQHQQELKQQQYQLQQQYQIQQQRLQQQQQLKQQQQQQVSQQQFSVLNQPQIVSQQFNPFQQAGAAVQPARYTFSSQQTQQQNPVQQRSSTKIVPSVELQRSLRFEQQLSSSAQDRQQSQIQIVPARMTMSQTILPQQTNTNTNSSPNLQPQSEIGSINVRLPSNSLVGLIPNTNIFDSNVNGNSVLERAQRRSDLFLDEPSGRERKSVYSGVSSYDVPLSSVGRLTNDITQLLLQRRL